MSDNSQVQGEKAPRDAGPLVCGDDGDYEFVGLDGFVLPRSLDLKLDLTHLYPVNFDTDNVPSVFCDAK